MAKKLTKEQKAGLLARTKTIYTDKDGNVIGSEDKTTQVMPKDKGPTKAQVEAQLKKFQEGEDASDHFFLPTREGKEEGGMPVDTYPNIPPEEMAEVEASQLPDEQMEENYLDYIVDQSLNEDDQQYLMNTLEADPRLSQIFDRVVGTASEFSGAGMVEGPGTGVSDSIPARLSDGEFVITRKATDAIGADNLQRMMDDAERASDSGQTLQMAFGGQVDEDEIDETSSKDYLSKTDEEIRKVMIGSNRMPSVR